MVMRFLYNNISFKQDTTSQESSVVVTGEITNNSGRDFNAVVFKMVLFIKTRCIGHLTITMNGFRNGQVRSFMESVSELESMPQAKITPEVIRHEIFPESAY